MSKRGSTCLAIPGHDPPLDITVFHDIPKNLDFNFSDTCNNEPGSTLRIGNEPGSNLHFASEGRTPLITYSREKLLQLRSSSNALVYTSIQDLRDCNILRKERPRACRHKRRNLIALTSSTESPTARVNNTVCERPDTASCFKRCQRVVDWKNLARVNIASSSTRLFAVPKSLFLNTCSLEKIKNRVRASVALAADFRSWDIDVGVISETHLCSQKPDSSFAIEGIQYIERTEIGPELISERKVELQYICAGKLKGFEF
ncbi:hypothetical protein AWC38_SpisGene5781 [Stylophora pistillata]|uniref:Uncharacterized protein n=1 Tax=Stylophora pistillata TaxID=50429 RepID=A0A2B4SKQ6_STYPI|nr:hypothetical protein AWC38_SpisGene5781 [Stylophora pistillata]